MEKTIFIDGHAAITIKDTKRVVNAQFLPDNQDALILEQSGVTHGQMQLFCNGSMDYVASKPRVRANSTLLRKAAHGRLSGTRDHAWQLTLKVFASEGIDWQRVFVTEPIETLTPLIGKGRMREILQGVLNRLDADDYATV